MNSANGSHSLSVGLSDSGKTKAFPTMRKGTKLKSRVILKRWGQAVRMAKKGKDADAKKAARNALLAAGATEFNNGQSFCLVPRDSFLPVYEKVSRTSRLVGLSLVLITNFN